MPDARQKRIPSAVGTSPGRPSQAGRRGSSRRSIRGLEVRQGVRSLGRPEALLGVSTNARASARVKPRVRSGGLPGALAGLAAGGLGRAGLPPRERRCRLARQASGSPRGMPPLESASPARRHRRVRRSQASPPACQDQRRTTDSGPHGTGNATTAGGHAPRGGRGPGQGRSRRANQPDRGPSASRSEHSLYVHLGGFRSIKCHVPHRVPHSVGGHLCGLVALYGDSPSMVGCIEKPPRTG